MASRTTVSLPCPGVRFEPGFARRLAILADRLALAGERREGGGVPSLLGAGAEFVGYRPYARGDDLRALDWDLYARARQPWVRVARRDAGERWLVRLDASASMGVGPPGKLQRAAEAAAGIAAFALRRGVEVRLRASGGEGGSREITVRRRRALAEVLAFLESLRAGGGPEPARACRFGRRPSRIFLVGDLFDMSREDALALRSPGCELAVVRILSPLEIAPGDSGAFEWWDPELDRRIVIDLDPATRDAYEAALAGEVESFRAACARRGIPYGCSSSALPMEEVLSRSSIA